MRDYRCPAINPWSQDPADRCPLPQNHQGRHHGGIRGTKTTVFYDVTPVTVADDSPDRWELAS